jgi:pimeloyl-ACP methyl ester carboxylesterase
VWRPIAERLALRRTPIFIGYPRLDGAPADPSIRNLSDLATLVLGALPNPVDLVAMSMGAAIAFRIALEYPGRIRKLVLVAPSGGIDVLALGGLEWREAYRKARPHAPSWFVDERVDFSERLGDIVAPTLLILGDDDLIAPVAVGQFLLERLPSAKLEIIEGATHDLQEEHPDLLASLIEAHLRAPELAEGH